MTRVRPARNAPGPGRDRCVRPGHWVIGGRDVVRARAYGARGPAYWEVRGPAGPPVRLGSLPACREYIAGLDR